jgi:hypothetical protein
MVRSVGRTKGGRGSLRRLFTRGERIREDFAFDFRDRGEDVWGALRM